MADKKVINANKGEEEVKWERWQKKRIFVRELAGKYGEIYKELYAQPRIYKSKGCPVKGGPVLFGQKTINPQIAKIIQAFEMHIETLAPGGHGQRHYHVNSAVFFILEGKGYDIHNGYRFDWEAGDAAIVENSCVHQHFNADPKKPATILVIKAKPTFGFNHMMIQKNIVYPPDKANPGFEDFKPAGHGQYPAINLD
ncbi:cupin domain-containing protein [Desulfitobacterium sp. AusDCA]|uniref:cupin domain-containing protein n=1 Tax=Desulfitobacterium sp. AusDCA TaxID=3240383 RepID=UPI003DA72862